MENSVEYGAMSQRRFTRGAEPFMPGAPIPRPTSPARRRRLLRRLLRWVLLLCIGLFVLASAAVAWVAKDLPRPDSLSTRASKESTKIYDRTGTTLLYEIGEIRRTRVPLTDIAPAMVQATIAAEDHDFYRHRGIALRGILRSVLRARPGRRLQGGSTITQQLLRNTLLTPERTFTRKVREQLLAIITEQRYSKDEILTMYLNEIPYGSNAYGVEAAAKTYFGTSAKYLSPAQAALLAALPKGPTYYSPYGSHVDELRARQQLILEQMRELGSLSEEELRTTKQENVQVNPRREPIIAPHFVFYVRELLEKEYGETLVEQSGLKVITSLDMRMQRAAEEVVVQQAEKNLAYNARNAALVGMNPKNGDILAMVGSVDYFDTANDGNVNVTIRPRSPGSSFKPIVYAELFRKGYTPSTILADAPIDFAAAGKSYSPKNFDGKFRGPVTVRQALAMSLNVPAVEALYLAGVNDAVALARRMGFTTLTDPDRYGLSLVLGGGEVRLLDEVTAYSVLAMEGQWHSSRAVLKVTSSDGQILLDATEEAPRGESVLDPQIARLVTSILTDNAARAPVFGTRSPLQLGERPVAAKTGTAQEFRDGWTLGYTPSLAAGVWVGNNDNTPMKKEPGVYTAAPIWNAFMRRVLEGTPIEQFTAPEPVETGKPILDGKIPSMDVRYEAETNLAVPANCGIGLGVAKQFVEFRSILHYLQRENPRQDPPERPENDPQYVRWEAGIASWRDKFNNENPHDNKRYVAALPDSACESYSNALAGRPSIRFISPADEVIRRSPVKIAVQLDAPAKVTSVEFFANDQPLGTRTEEPWETLYRFKDTTHGDITLRVKATTEEGKTNEVRKTVKINPDNTLPFVEILTPRNRETRSPSSFPLTITAKATDPSGIASVEALYALAGDSRLFSLGKATSTVSGNPTRFTIVWESAPAPGTYELRVRATDKTGNQALTSPLTLTIP